MLPDLNYWQIKKYLEEHEHDTSITTRMLKDLLEAYETLLKIIKH
jgi:hypothetical protein